MKKIIVVACIALVGALFSEERVLVFAGSTRKDSYNRTLALEAADVARNMGAQVQVIDLKDYPMPFYDADLEEKQGLPKNAKRFRDEMVASQAIIIASPEYNGSVPALLKNALDWASRSDGSAASAFEGKKFAIMSASPGRGGGKRALVHLAQIIESAGGEVVAKQVSVPNAYEENALHSSSVRKTLQEEVKQLLK